MKILVLDDMDERHLVFAEWFKGHEVVHVHNYDEACSALATMLFDLVYLDRDLNLFQYRSVREYGGVKYELSGEDVVKYLVAEIPRERWPKRIIVHSWNMPAAERMVAQLREAGIEATYAPFTPPPGFDD